MENQNTAALAPCPFCGGAAQFEVEHRSSRVIECQECGASVGAHDLDQGVTMWNRRASHPSPQAAAEGVGSRPNEKRTFHVYDETEGLHDSVVSSHFTLAEAISGRLVAAEELKDHEFSITKTGGGHVLNPADWQTLQQEQKEARVKAFSCAIRCMSGVEEGCDRWCGNEDKCTVAFVVSAALTEPAQESVMVPEGWQLVPVVPTEEMVIDGFESVPSEGFTPLDEWEQYEAMSGCQQAAHRARLCYAAMLAAAPSHRENAE